MNKIGTRTARDSVKTNSKSTSLVFLKLTMDVLKDAIVSGKEDLNEIKQELATLENGRLFVRHRGETVIFSHYDATTKKEMGITGKSESIHALARRAYLEERIKLIENSSYRFEKLLRCLEKYAAQARSRSRLKQFSEAGLDLTRILFSKEQNEWLDHPYTPNPYYRENLNYTTNGGILTRSKSEAIIGNALESMGIPYRSDDLVGISSEDRSVGPFRDTYFADFKVPNLNGGITIHEHLGAFHMENYSENALKRLNDYHNHSVYELPNRKVKHNEFTWSFENDVRTSASLTLLIRRMLLPGNLTLG